MLCKIVKIFKIVLDFLRQFKYFFLFAIPLQLMRIAENNMEMLETLPEFFVRINKYDRVVIHNVVGSILLVFFKQSHGKNNNRMTTLRTIEFTRYTKFIYINGKRKRYIQDNFAKQNTQMYKGIV